MKYSKAGSSTKIKWYPSYLARAIELGYPDMFEIKSYEQIGLERVEYIANIYRDTGNNPSQISSDANAASCGRWLTYLRNAKNGKKMNGKKIIGMKWYPSFLVRAIELGHPDMFKFRSREQEGLQRVEYIAKFYKKTGHNPRSKSSDRYEASCANWQQRTRGYKNTSSIRWCPSYLARAIELGYPVMFDLKSGEQVGLERVDYIAKFYKKTGNNPRQKASDVDEARCGKWLSQQKQMLIGNSKNTKWYPSYLDRAIELGCPDMFNVKK